MSRLDDELKLALRRADPSPDFTERVLKAINSPPAPERSWWQSLMDGFQLPRVRWVAAAVAASLLIMIGALQYWQPRPVEKEQKEANVGVETTPKRDSNGGSESAGSLPPDVAANSASGSNNEATPKNVRNNKRPNRRRALRPPSVEELAKEAEGQLAKERLLLALRIAGTTLSEAQRVIRGDDEQPAPEPATRR